MLRTFDRRQFLALASASLAQAQESVSRPVVSEEACPLVPFEPVAKDGFRGRGLLRKPPGPGPFPAILWVHGGLVTISAARLQGVARAPNPSRFLAAGYVVLVPTYRSRDDDPQSPVSLADTLAVVDYARRLSYVDPQSIVVYGCSGGGDLALEVAAATEVCAAVPEEPASLLMAGIFNAKLPKKGDRFTPLDVFGILEEPEKYYTPEYQKIMRAKIARIRCPILIIQGDQERREVPVNHFNAKVLYPELRAAGKQFEVMTYPGEPHCFCFVGGGPQTPHPDAALKASRDIDGFCRRYLKTKPKALDPALVTPAPV